MPGAAEVRHENEQRYCLYRAQTNLRHDGGECFRLATDGREPALRKGQAEAAGDSDIKDAGRSSGVDDEILAGNFPAKLALGDHQKPAVNFYRNTPARNRTIRVI